MSEKMKYPSKEEEIGMWERKAKRLRKRLNLCESIIEEVEIMLVQECSESTDFLYSRKDILKRISDMENGRS